MRRVEALGLVVAVFAVGLIAGVLGGRLVPNVSPGPPDLGPPPFQRYFSRGDLDLTAEQRRQMKEVFTRQRAKFEDLHRDLRPQVEALMDETQAQIEAILTPEQRERFSRRRNRWLSPRGRRDPRHDDQGRQRRHPEVPSRPESPPPAANPD